MSTGTSKLRPYTTFYQKSFLWRSHITVNDQSVKVGVNEKELITIKNINPKVEIPFYWFVKRVHEILQSHKLPEVSKYWYEKAPLFLLDVSCSEDLRKLFTLSDKVLEEVALDLRCKMESELKTSTPDATNPICVSVQTEVYLMTPDNVNKTGKAICINEKNRDAFTELFSQSAVFDFDAVFGVNPTKEDKGKVNYRK